MLLNTRCLGLRRRLPVAGKAGGTWGDPCEGGTAGQPVAAGEAWEEAKGLEMTLGVCPETRLSC